MDESSVVENFASRSELIALAILVVGLIVARLVSVLVGRLLAALDRRAARFATTDVSLLSPKVIRLTRTFFFWLVLVLAVLLALRVFGVSGLALGFDSLIELTPKVLVALSIIVVGHLLGLVASQLISQIDDDITTDSIGPRLVHAAIVTVAIVLGLQHLSVDISFITRLILILVATLSAGLMLAFALGARQHVSNLLARRELSRLSIGQHVRIDGIEGRVVDIYSTGFDVATDEGVASIPAARLADTGLLRKTESDESG